MVSLSICSCSITASIGEILLFSSGATHKVNVISTSQAGDGFSIDEDIDVVVIESLLHCSLKIKVHQDGKEKTCLTNANRFSEEVLLLSMEKYCVTGVSIEFLNDLHLPFFNVEHFGNIS